VIVLSTATLGVSRPARIASANSSSASTISMSSYSSPKYAG
jgi:hypothetical protein